MDRRACPRRQARVRSGTARLGANRRWAVHVLQQPVGAFAVCRQRRPLSSRTGEAIETRSAARSDEDLRLLQAAMSAAGTEASHPGINVGPTSDFSKPIFAVDGTAYGGGFELAQSTDFILAAESATFGQPEAMLGLAAGGGSPALLPRLLPRGKALQMLMTGDPHHRCRGIPARDGQRGAPTRRAHGRGDAGCGEDCEQLPHRGAGGQAGGSPGRGATDRAGHRDHDGRAVALGGPPRPRRGIGAFNEGREPSFKDADF